MAADRRAGRVPPVVANGVACIAAGGRHPVRAQGHHRPETGEDRRRRATLAAAPVADATAGAGAIDQHLPAHALPWPGR